MMTKLLDIDGSEIDDLVLPPIFDTPYRPDIIRKVYVNLSSLRYQPQGRYPAAGEMVSAESRNTGLGIARIARARGEGFPRAGQAAGVAGVRHGRVAHPPVSWKIIDKKVNKKEKMLGFCSAVAATANKEIINRRGHKTGEISNFPLVVSNEIEKIIKTSDLKKSLSSLGLQEDLNRSQSIKRIPSGKSRMRGRSRRTALSSIIVVSTGASICKLRHSLPGVEVKSIDELSVLDLAPGANPIRLTVYSKNAIEKLADVKTRILKVAEMVTSL
ncbi:MAG: 50S ribosomal protein L4 [Thermoproteota archaeon]|nr:50S ribosomal protein L4 [Thermoproteota archaeon]